MARHGIDGVENADGAAAQGRWCPAEAESIKQARLVTVSGMGRSLQRLACKAALSHRRALGIVPELPVYLSSSRVWGLCDIPERLLDNYGDDELRGAESAMLKKSTMEETHVDPLPSE